MIFSKRTKEIISWSLYDWASSSFPVIVTTFIFATYFTKSIAVDEITGTYQWASATALAGIIIAITSPIFGAIADHYGHHKRWLFIFTYICIISTALLTFAYPNPNFITYTLTCVVIGTIGLEVATVFYNAFLPHLAPPDYVGRISGWAWGLGYIGGIVALALALFIYQRYDAIRLCGLLAAGWYLLFSLPIFLNLPETPRTGLSIAEAIKRGLRELKQTLIQLPAKKDLLIYLIAHLIYIDGLNTLFAFGGIYAVGTFKMSFSEVLIFGITMNIAAGMGAILLAWIDDYLGSKPTILISLACLITLGFILLFVQSKNHFWMLALLLCLFVGPVQSASRSLMSRMTPLKQSTEMFGLYALSGKITSFMGPWLFGAATLYFNTQRAGMATILMFLMIGGLILLIVNEPKKLAKTPDFQ